MIFLKPFYNQLGLFQRDAEWVRIEKKNEYMVPGIHRKYGRGGTIFFHIAFP